MVDNVGHGTLTFNADGSFGYIPAADYYGIDSFTYLASDGVADSNTVMVTLMVIRVKATFGLDYDMKNASPDVLTVTRFLNGSGNGTLTKIEMLFDDSTPSGSVRLGVYADDNGMPGDLLLDAGTVAVADGWVGIDGLSLSVSDNTYYWLGYVLEDGNGVVSVTGPGENTKRSVGYTYGPFPAQYPAGSAGDNTQDVLRATVSINPQPPDF